MSSEPASARPAEAVVTVDAQGWFRTVSPGFLELIGAPVERLSSSNLVDHLHPDDAATARQLLASASSGSAPVALFVDLFDATGEWAPVELCFEAGSGDRLTFRLRKAFAGGKAAVSPIVAPPETALQSTPGDGRSHRAEAVPSDSFRPAPEPTPEAPAAPAVRAVTQPESTSNDEFLYDDSPEHLAYVASLPANDIVDRRVAARAAAGPVDTPMLEIDGEGRTVYVKGPWADLGDDGATGADVFEQLLERSGSVDLVLQSIDDACRRSESGRHPMQVAGLPPRWIVVTPIPSPHLASETNALISIVAESQLHDSVE